MPFRRVLIGLLVAAGLAKGLVFAKRISETLLEVEGRLDQLVFDHLRALLRLSDRIDGLAPSVERRPVTLDDPPDVRRERELLEPNP